jgi:hypothetical protein
LGFLNTAAVFDSFGRAIPGGEQPQQIAEVPCNDTTLTLGADADNRLVDYRRPRSDQPEACVVTSASRAEEPELASIDLGIASPETEPPGRACRRLEGLVQFEVAAPSRLSLVVPIKAEAIENASARAVGKLRSSGAVSVPAGEYTCLVVDLISDQQAADDQVGERVRNLAVGFKVGLDVLLHSERNVGVADSLGQSFPVEPTALRLLASGA